MTSAAPALRAFYLDAARGRRFCLHHAPASGALRGALLYVHPFAEEMNKSRRMAALASRGFAAQGWAVLQIDLAGCGDSSGDLADATWDDWVTDVHAGLDWLQRHSGQRPALWGLRAGCLLALDAAHALPAPVKPDRYLFWQPPASGKTLAQQFLRLRAAAGALRSQEPGAATSAGAAPAERAGEELVEVAGYRLHPHLLAGLEQARLRPPPQPSQAIWIEVSTRDGATLLPATQRAHDEWTGAGHRVSAAVVPGPGFWQTQEIEDAPALIEASLAALAAQQPLAAPMS